MTPSSYLKFQALARKFNYEHAAEIIDMIEDANCDTATFNAQLKEWALDLHEIQKQEIVKRYGIEKCIEILGIGMDELAGIIENAYKRKSGNVIELLGKKYRSREFGGIMNFDKEYLYAVIGYKKSANEIIGILKSGNRISEKVLDRIIEMVNSEEYEEVQEAQLDMFNFNS